MIDEIRTDESGRGVPRVQKIIHTVLGATREDDRTYTPWETTWPDPVHFECCGRTDSHQSDNWTMALLVAQWKRQP